MNNKREMEVIGFVNLGDLKNSLLEMERIGDGEAPYSNIATHVLVLMVRGLASQLTFPYAHFATTGVTAYALMSIMWEAVEILECCGFKVMGTSCDNAAPNRKFFRLHPGVSTEGGVTYKTRNMYSKEERWLYFAQMCHI